MSHSTLIANRTTITRLRLRGGGQDPLAAQLRLARDLNAATVRPPALPPNAILCVRRLTSRAPALHTHATPWATPWEPALTEALARCVQHAARPAHGPAPANAVAVLFADHAEMLACLAETWLGGGDATQWWWQTLFAAHDLTQTVMAAWLDASEAAPAALEHLAHKRQAINFVRALPTTTATTLLARIITTFGLHTLHTALHIDPAPITGENAHTAGHAPPWQTTLSDTNMRDLPRDQQLLLGVALMVRRAPAALRSKDFAAHTAHWWQHAAPARDDLPRPSTGNAPTTDLPSDTAAPPPPPVSPPQPPATADTPRSPSNVLSMQFDAPQDAPSPAPDVPAPPALDAETPMPALPAAAFAQHEIDIDATPQLTSPPLASAAREEVSPMPRVPTTTLETEFGGLFYLINVGIYLELYADFTTPLARGINLDIFDFLALVGEAWLGDPLHADPLWALLAELAGRNEDEPPGAHFTPLDNAPLTAWLAALLETIEHRLRAALDWPAGQEERALSSFLCAHHAEVVVSATHLDIHLSLADLPIEIRVSGLDRNPGWVPAAGRTVTFYFD